MSIESGKTTASTPTAKEREWRGILARWKASGLKGRAFCKREGIQESAFFHWKRQIRLRDEKRQGGAAKFVPVTVARPIGFFDVTVLGGRSVRVAADFDPAALTKLLAVLEGRAC